MRHHGSEGVKCTQHSHSNIWSESRSCGEGREGIDRQTDRDRERGRGEGEGEREGGRDRGDRQTDRETERETDRQTHRYREMGEGGERGGRGREGGRERERDERQDNSGPVIRRPGDKSDLPAVQTNRPLQINVLQASFLVLCNNPLMSFCGFWIPRPTSQGSTRKTFPVAHYSSILAVFYS